MSKIRRRPRLLLACLAVASLSVLTACTVSLPGGIVGGILALLLSGSLFFGVGATQTGCASDDNGPDAGMDVCLSPPAPDGGGDAQVGPCLSPPAPDAHVGPCLDPPAPDAHIGPCLSPPAPDAGEKDAHIGPCLSPPAPDGGGNKDAHIGPCLSIAPPDAGLDVARAQDAHRQAGESLADERKRLLARFDADGTLPADVAERLRAERLKRG